MHWLLFVALVHATASHGDFLARSGGLRHIGLVTSRRLIMHNIGAGEVIEDVLFSWPIAGHYRYFGNHSDEEKHNAK